MSDLKHRKIIELKTFIKKYNSHFSIALTGKKKADLIKSINDGMQKNVTDDLQKDYDLLSSISAKVKVKEADMPKIKPVRKAKVTPVPRGKKDLENEKNMMKDYYKGNLADKDVVFAKPRKEKPVFKLAPPRPVGVVARPTKKSTTIRYKPKKPKAKTVKAIGRLKK